MPDLMSPPAHPESIEMMRSRIQGLREAEEARTTFLRAAVHELRAPLTPLLMQLQMALRADLEPQLREGLEAALRAAERLEMLATDLLNIGQTGALGFDIQQGSVDLQDVVAEVAASLRVPATVKGIDIQLDGADPVCVQGDKKRLVQVAGNLVNNAIRFTPRNGRIRLAAWNEKGQACFSVTDSGPGIPEDQRENLFKPFQQLHKAAVDGGTGLGLFICRNIVAAHGGHIDVSHGPGATFTIRLPA